MSLDTCDAPIRRFRRPTTKLANMRMFTDVPRHPFTSMWMALFIGFPISTLLMEVVAPGAAGSIEHRVGWFGFILFMSLVVGVAITLLVATPTMYLLVRCRIAGPLTAILFGLAVIAVSGAVADQPGSYLTAGIYTTCTVSVYLCGAHPWMFSIFVRAIAGLKPESRR
jgi:hypothetical protein